MEEEDILGPPSGEVVCSVVGAGDEAGTCGYLESEGVQA